MTKTLNHPVCQKGGGIMIFIENTNCFEVCEEYISPERIRSWKPGIEYDNPKEALIAAFNQIKLEGKE